MAETVVIRFRGEDDVTPVANKVETSVDKVGKAVKDAGKGFNALGEIGIGALRGIGEVALDLGKNALGGVADFFKTAVQGTLDYQNALAQTEAVFKSTGGAVGVTVEQLENLARNLSAVEGASLFTDDQILGAQNILMTFTNIQDLEFADATAAIVDLSQAMGQDLQSSAIQVGKALNDPAEGITALTRVGVSFTEEQKAMVAALVETGDTAEAQRIILSELERQFGGSAAAAAGTFSGQMVVMQEKIEDAKGAIGDALVPLLQEMTTLLGDYALPVIQDVTAQIGAFFQNISASGGVMASLSGIRTAFDNLVASSPLLQRLIVLGQELWTTLTSLFADTMELASDPAVQDWMGQVATVLETTLIVAIDAVILVLKGLRFAFGVVVDGIKLFADAMTPIFNYVYPKMAAVISTLSQLLRGDFAGAWMTISTVVGKVMSDIAGVVSRVIDTVSSAIRNFIREVINDAVQLGRNIVQGIADGIRAAKNAVVEALKSALTSGITAIKQFLGIASPSREMARLIGQPIAQGIAAGIVSGVPDIQRALNVAVSSATGAPTQTVQNFYLTANYQTAQSQSSLTADLRAMQLLAGGVA